MKVLALTRYTRNGASSRIRTLQYLPWLTQQGLDIEVSPLLDDEYLRRLYGGQRMSVLALSKALFNRVRQLLRARSFDLLWIEKELFPMMPAWAEWLLHRFGVPFVVDYDDAIFHNYDLNKNAIVRILLGQKIDKIMCMANAVVAGNEYLAARASAAGASRVELIPSVVDLNHYALRKPQSPGKFIIGWIGTPKTAKYLDSVSEALRDICANGGVVLRLVGSGPKRIPGVSIETKAWQESAESEDVGSFDVGIMPLPDSPWENGKCGYKLIQYMACGVPVVASPVGANKKIVRHGENGFLAETNAEWLQALAELRDNPALREQLGEAARSTVETNYCLAVSAAKLLRLLKLVASDHQ